MLILVNQVQKTQDLFGCDLCQKGFRNHGKLSKHFKSKIHVQALENCGELPHGGLKSEKSAKSRIAL